MTAAAAKRWRYGPGYISLSPYGTYSAFVALGHGKRRRANLKTLAEAKAWVLSGTSGSAPDQLLLEDALRARERLPASVSLDDAARFWVESHKAKLGGTPLSEAWTRYSAEASRLIRPRTMCSYRQAASALVEAVGGSASLDSVSASRIEALVAARPPQTRNTYIRALSAFFSWCVAHDLAASNPAAKVKKAKIPKRTPAVFSPADARRLLSIAATVHPRSVAYFALGLFAGLRPEEAARIRPSDILNGYVVLGGDITKTADARTVPVRPNLAAWLEKLSGVTGKELMDGMMSVGSALTSLTPAQAIDSDRKSYAESGYKFSLAQLEESNFVLFHRQLDALGAELERVRTVEGLDFAALLVTDPLRGNSDLLFRGAETVRRALPWRVGAHGLFNLPGVLSRKKQLLPEVLSCLP